jgi:predicted hydrocarbon binding protein
MGFYFYPGMKGFHIVARLKDDPGALYSLLGFLHDRVDFANSTSYSLRDGGAIWSGFGKSLSKSETAVRLKKRIERSPFVLECEVHESDKGLLIDSFHSGLDIAPDRPGIIFPLVGISRIYDRLAQAFGSGGETILFEEGSALGRSDGKYLNARFGKGSLDWRIKAVLGMYRANGWGSVTLEVEKPSTRFKFRIGDCVECAGKVEQRKGCNFVKGHLNGMVSTLADKEFQNEETKCRLRGDSFCEFLLSRKEA